MSEHTPRWVDRHSVNCMGCNALVDERETVTPEDGEGSYCGVCWDRLIAAAPELLEACRNAINTLRDLDPETRAYTTQLEAAIAKAEGT